jgi:hypothetical protein
MGEEIFAAAVRSNEAKTLRVVEPLYSTGCHCYVPLHSKKGLSPDIVFDLKAPEERTYSKSLPQYSK